MASLAAIIRELDINGTTVEERGGSLYTWLDDPGAEGGEEALDEFNERLAAYGLEATWTGKSNRNDRGEESSEVRITRKGHANAYGIATPVVYERMPEQHRESHRAAGNWGVYPHNGAERVIMDRADAEALDDDEYDSILRDARPDDFDRYDVEVAS